jgi:hypothetical protein
MCNGSVIGHLSLVTRRSFVSDAGCESPVTSRVRTADHAAIGLRCGRYDPQAVAIETSCK